MFTELRWFVCVSESQLQCFPCVRKSQSSGELQQCLPEDRGELLCSGRVGSGRGVGGSCLRVFPAQNGLGLHGKGRARGLMPGGLRMCVLQSFILFVTGKPSVGHRGAWRMILFVLGLIWLHSAEGETLVWTLVFFLNSSFCSYNDSSIYLM